MELNELLREINAARANPKAYSNKLIYQMSYIRKGDSKLILPTQEVIQIKEGSKAYHEGIDHLKQCVPLCPLRLNVPLCFISVNEAFKRAREGGELPEGITTDRLKRYGRYETIGEIAFVTDAVKEVDYESLVTQMLVSDGDERRTNRNVMLNEDVNVIGLGKCVFDSRKILIDLIFAKNWDITSMNNDYDSLDTSILNNYSDEREKELLKEVSNYEAAIQLKVREDYQYASMTESKKLLRFKEQLKLIKRYHIALDNNLVKDISFSKSFYY